MKEFIDNAIAARKAGKPEDAYTILSELLKSHPSDSVANYQMAWTCDSMGKESEAIQFYEIALNNGLGGDDKRGAMLGLGSTYRCLGQYHKSKEIFEQAIAIFPTDRSFQVFLALTLYNLGKSNEAVGSLLNLLLDTTSDDSIKAYGRALRFYSDKLDETWD